MLSIQIVWIYWLSHLRNILWFLRIPWYSRIYDNKNTTHIHLTWQPDECHRTQSIYRILDWAREYYREATSNSHVLCSLDYGVWDSYQLQSSSRDDIRYGWIPRCTLSCTVWRARKSRDSWGDSCLHPEFLSCWRRKHLPHRKHWSFSRFFATLRMTETRKETTKNHPRYHSRIWSWSLVNTHPSLSWVWYPCDMYEPRLSYDSSWIYRALSISCETPREVNPHHGKWQYRAQSTCYRMGQWTRISMGNRIRLSSCRWTHRMKKLSSMGEYSWFPELVRCISACTSELWSSLTSISPYGREFTRWQCEVHYSWYHHGKPLYAECSVEFSIICNISL